MGWNAAATNIAPIKTGKEKTAFISLFLVVCLYFQLNYLFAPSCSWSLSHEIFLARKYFMQYITVDP